MSAALPPRRAAAPGADATPARVRPPPRRAWPWTDRNGRVSPLKASVLALVTAPAVALAIEWASGHAGARPVTEMIHQTGLMAVRLLVVSLLLSPARAVLQVPPLLLVRRMVGVAACAYAGAHLVLYACDENWDLVRVVSEIVHRFYLLVGLAALLGLAALSVTSTNGWMRRLGRGWKRLHRLAYPVAALALFHFFLQSKADVSHALVYAGAFGWLMAWRALPAGPDRSIPAVAGLALVAALLTVALEYLWYHFATRIPPARVLWAELDLAFGPRPAGQVLLLGAAALGTLLVRRAQLAAPPLPARLAVTVGAVLLAALLVYAFGITWDALPDALPDWGTLGIAAVLAGGLGVGWWVRDRRVG